MKLNVDAKKLNGNAPLNENHQNRNIYKKNILNSLPIPNEIWRLSKPIPNKFLEKNLKSLKLDLKRFIMLDLHFEQPQYVDLGA